TAKAYAEAYFGEAGPGFDAVTASPLLGRDSLEPLIEGALAAGAGCFVLVRTSNPGAAEIQDAPAPDRPLHELLARMVAELGASRRRGSGGATRGDLGAQPVAGPSGPRFRLEAKQQRLARPLLSHHSKSEPARGARRRVPVAR